MIRALYSAATGMAAQQIRIDVIANNLANVNTGGFKRGRANFEDLLYQVEVAPGTSTSGESTSPNGIKIGTGSKVVSVEGVHAQGAFEQTGNSYDLGIEGRGFFQVTLPGGQSGYTRAGSLSVDANGALVTQNGYPVSSFSGTLSSTDVLETVIGQDGTVSQRLAGQDAPSSAGNIQLYMFANESGLLNIGRNMFVATDSSGTATAATPGQNGAGTLRQGMIESSNVDIATELVTMISAQRAYELNSKVIRAADEIMQSANSIR